MMNRNNKHKVNRTTTNKMNPPLFFGVLLFFGLTLFSFFTRLPPVLHDWTSGWYAMDYSMGFGSRLLIGSLLHLFYPDFLPADAAYHFVIITLIVIFVVMLVLFAYSIYKAPFTASRNGLALMMIFYLASPGSIAYLWSTEILGRFDTYLVLLILLSVLLWLCTSSYMLRCLLILILGSLCLAIHQVFLFLYFPVLFTMLLLPLEFSLSTSTYNLSNTQKEKAAATKLTKETRRNLLSGFLVILVLVVQLLYYQFGTSLSIGSSQELAALLTSRTDLPVMENALYFEYFASFREMLSAVVMNEIGERIRYTVIAFLFLSPLFFYYGLFLVKVWKAEKKDSQTTCEKAVLILMPLSLLSFLPAFLLTKDWGRWSSALLLVLLLQIILLTLTKKEASAAAFTSILALLKKLWILLVLYVIFLASLEKYQVILLPQAPAFFQFVYQLLRG